MDKKLLNEDIVYEIIVELYAKEKTIKRLSEEFNVSKKVIGLINDGCSYKIDHYKYPIRTCTDSLVMRGMEKSK